MGVEGVTTGVLGWTLEEGGMGRGLRRGGAVGERTRSKSRPRSRVG